MTRPLPGTPGALAGLVAIVLVGLGSPPARGQVMWQPTPRPLTTAEREPWYQRGEPITYEGSVYYPAGPQVHFNGNVMVRIGAYRGIPLYADTTLEPFSKVFVPLAGGLMQPYERRRAGDLAGTTGSQAPSFPVSIAGERPPGPPPAPLRATPGPPVFSQPADVGAEQEREAAAEASQRAAAMRAGQPEAAPAPTGTTGTLPRLTSVERPRGLNEIFVSYQGFRWRSAGPAVPFQGDRFTQVGEYHGFPVYAARGEEGDPQRIYLPSRANLVAPYEKAGPAPPPRY